MDNKQLSKNFSLKELTNSATAIRKGIDNTPNKEQIDNLTRLCVEVLQPIRDEYGDSIIVSSGFRCDKLNAAVSGAKNSDHRFACAADIHTVSDSVEDNKKLFNLILDMAKKGKISCRQIIDEYNYNWVHVSINNKYNSKKNNEVLHIR